MHESRVKKSIQNAKVNFIFYLIMLFLSFFSRKIFLDTLGANFMGLSGTLQNILSMLSLAEIGVGTSISFHLYKPIRDKNYDKINELISLFGWLYRIVGTIILVCGIIISCFFTLIFSNTEINFPVIYFVFYSFLCSSLIGYFINYRQLLLTADQRNYVVNVYLQGGQVIKIIIQIILCINFCNYFLWAIIELLFSIISCIILNIRINQTYPWLLSKPQLGFKIYKKYPYIIHSTKQIFIHRIKDFLLKQSDQILIFAFVSLKMVAYYGNYSLLIAKVTQLCTSVLDSASAGVGNLVAEGNKMKIMKVFWELMSIRYFAAGLISILLYFLIPPFISIWLGKEYLLNELITLLLCINTFIMLSRTTIDNFNHAYGQYADTWAAWVEGFINLFVTIVTAYLWGIIGILLGKIVSLFFIVILWKPLYLFRDGFHISVNVYWKKTLIYYFVTVLSIIILLLFVLICPINPYQSWNSFILYSIYISLIFIVEYTLLMYILAPGFKSFLNRFLQSNIIKK